MSPVGTPCPCGSQAIQGGRVRISTVTPGLTLSHSRKTVALFLLAPWGR